MSRSKTYGSMADYIGGEYSDKIFLFKLAKENRFPTVVRANGQPMKYPALVQVPLQDTILEKGIMKNIRYTEGVQSIFTELQNKDTDLKQAIFSAPFQEGVYVVEGSNKTLVEFMMKTNYNGSNPDRNTSKMSLFLFVDRKTDYKDAITKDKAGISATAWCYDEKNWDALSAYARVLMGSEFEGKSSDEIRFNMNMLAKRNPAKFMADKDSPKMKRKHHVLIAIERGILKVVTNTRSIAWASNPSQPLSTAPIGLDIIDYFVEATFTPGGESIYTAIQEFLLPKIENAEMLNVEIPKSAPVTNPIVAPLVEVNLVGDDTLENLFDRALEAEVIAKNAMWRAHGDFKAPGKKAFLKEMKGNKALTDSIQEGLDNL